MASLTDDTKELKLLADGNLDKRNIWLIGVGHTSTASAYYLRIHAMLCWYSIQTEIRVVDCMDLASARQNFDGDMVASSRNFNDAMVRNRRFMILISDRIGY